MMRAERLLHLYALRLDAVRPMQFHPIDLAREPDDGDGGPIWNMSKEILMPKSTFAGHPLHPMLIVAPAALLPFGFILDAMHSSTHKASYSNAAYYSLVGGLIGGAAAAAAGVMDYLTIEPETDVKRTANMHAILNSGALAMTAANVMMRKDQPAHAGGSLALAGLAALGVLVSGWFGGRMVYEQGMRVKGVSPVEHVPELEMPGGKWTEKMMMKEEEMAPRGGPQLQ
jgi:uncharacterized membrane protein